MFELQHRQHLRVQRRGQTALAKLVDLVKFRAQAEIRMGNISISCPNQTNPQSGDASPVYSYSDVFRASRVAREMGCTHPNHRPETPRGGDGDKRLVDRSDPKHPGPAVKGLHYWGRKRMSPPAPERQLVFTRTTTPNPNPGESRQSRRGCHARGYNARQRPRLGCWRGDTVT